MHNVPVLDAIALGNIIPMIQTQVLYILSVLIPLLLMPVTLPMVVLMARRKRLTDNPNARKTQSSPVAVMGGTVIMLIICITLIVLNLFYDISFLFPALCVMMILYIFGMLDDNIGLSWKFKMVLQVFFIVLLFYGGNYGVDSLYGLFGIKHISGIVAFLLTLFSGILLLNAVNFSDGIDGLASGLGVLAGAVMGYWNVYHGFTTQALLSFVIVGVMLGFFCFNVFSERYKMYMGDSGSLVLGLFIFMSACPNSYSTVDESFLVDRYFNGFIVSLLSAMMFDLVRVVIMRVLDGKSPFEPDRTHLHHAYVDAGMSHFLATLKIIAHNCLMLVLWYYTATSGISVVLQYVLILVAGVLLFWAPYFYLTYLKKKSKPRYVVLSKRNLHRSEMLGLFSRLMRRIIDGRRKPVMSQKVK